MALSSVNDLNEEVIPEEKVEVDQNELESELESEVTDDTILKNASISFDHKQKNNKEIREELWPNKTEDYKPKFDPKNYPISFLENTSKEKRVIAYCENFQRQYYTLCTDRTRLFIIPRNEFGIPKFVCTTIRRTLFPYPEFNNWSGCSRFVADFLNLLPLRPLNEPPKRLFSPTTIMNKQLGSVFDFTNLLCSLLLGAGYDAYVVHGYATREVCFRDLKNFVSPYFNKEEKEQEMTREKHINKYAFRPSKALKSKYDLYMEARQIKTEEDKRKNQEICQQKLEQQLDTPAFDKFYGLRVHSWILVLSGKREVAAPFFIEPLTGLSVSVKDVRYLGIEAVWNDDNYWVCMQDCSTGISHLSYDLNDSLLWEYVMPLGYFHNKISPPNNEPLNKKAAPDWEQIHSTLDYGEEIVNVEDEENNKYGFFTESKPNSKTDFGNARIILREKPGAEFRKLALASPLDKSLLFDLPPSWTLPLVLNAENHRKKYPNYMKTTYYKRAIETLYADYFNPDGLVYRLLIYEDRDHEKLIETIELYKNRNDRLVLKKFEHKTNWIEERFDPGPTVSNIKSHKYQPNESVNGNIRGNRIITFYNEARTDGLSKREFENNCMSENFENREDHLYFMRVIYKKSLHDSKVKFADNCGENQSISSADETAIIESSLDRIIQRFKRNPELAAEEDVKERIFNFSEDKIQITYHLGKDRIVSSTRDFNKNPSEDNRSESIKLLADTHEFFSADPFLKPKTNPEIYNMFLYFLDQESKALGTVKKSQIETQIILDSRAKDEFSCALETHLFDTLRIEEAKESRIKAEELAIEESKRIAEPELDFLLPYIQRLCLDPQNISKENAFKLREESLNDFKFRLVNKANIIQARFEQETETLRLKQQWYQLNQKHLKKKDEEEYLQYCKDAIFRIHTLETMINRHKQVAPQKYMSTEKKLRADPRIADHLI